MRPGLVVSLLPAMCVLVAGISVASPPHAAPATANPLDGAWSGLFGLPIRDGQIRAITSFNGQTIVGGTFTQAASVRAHNVAAWDGTHWHALGDGIPWPVEALTVYGGELIAAGAKPPLSPSGPSLYSWNGVEWTAIASTDAAIHALAAFNGELCVGGDFNTVNGVAAARIARWNQSEWRALGSGVGGTGTRSVRALAVLGAKLVAGGTFTDFQSIASWDGVTWSGLGPGVQLSAQAGKVNALAVVGSDLLVAGQFDHAGSLPENNVARWNGAGWSQVGTLPPQDAVSQWLGAPIAGATISGAVRPARWDGSSWMSDGSPPLQPFAYVNDGTMLYCGGFATSVLAPDGFARFDGVTWTGLQEPWAPGMSGLNAPVNGMLTFGGRVYVAGYFALAGQDGSWLATSRVASWDGNVWTSTPATLGGVAYSLATYNGALLAGGHGWVARLDPGVWTPIGGTVGGDVDAMAQYGTDLIAIGNFGTAGGGFAYGIARWNGTSWSALGSGFDIVSGDEPAAVVSFGGEIVVGGYLTSSGGTALHHLVHWTGSAFTDLGGGADGPVAALAVSGADLLVGGAFTHVGGIEAHGAARWNGSTWTALGDNAKYVTAFREHGAHLFAAGEFVDAFGADAYGVAEWTGDRWYPLGSGVDGTAYTLDFLGDDIYLGGTFGWGYGMPSFNIASLPSVSLVSVGESPRTTALSLVAGPNPAHGSTRFTLSLPSAGHVRLTVHDVSGGVVAVLADEDRAAGRSFATWTGRAAPGIYLATLEAGGTRRTFRVVRLE